MATGLIEGALGWPMPVAYMVAFGLVGLLSATALKLRARPQVDARYNAPMKRCAEWEI